MKIVIVNIELETHAVFLNAVRELSQPFKGAKKEVK